MDQGVDLVQMGDDSMGQEGVQQRFYRWAQPCIDVAGDWRYFEIIPCDGRLEMSQVDGHENFLAGSVG